MPTRPRAPIVPQPAVAGLVSLAAAAAGALGLYLVLPPEASSLLGPLTGGLAAITFLATLTVTLLRPSTPDVSRRDNVIVDAAADAILTFDAAGRIESANAAACRLVGCTPTEIVGRTLADLLVTNTDQGVESLLRRAVQTGEGRVLVREPALQVRHAAGHLIPVELGVSKVIDENRRIYIQILRDLRQRSAQYDVARLLAGDEPLAECGPPVLAVLGTTFGWPAGLLWLLDGEMQLLHCVGLWTKDPQLQPFVDALARVPRNRGDGLPGRVWQKCELCLVADVGEDSEIAYASTDGRPGVRAALAWPLEAGGEFLGVIEFYADELPASMEAVYPLAAQLGQYARRARDAAELRRAKAAAEEANRAKGEFLTNISHEIRTPLNGIIGIAEVMNGEDLAAGQREYLRLIQSSAGTLLGLVNDLLDLAKIEAARMTVSAVPFVVREQLEPTLRILAVRAGQKGLTFHWAVGLEVPAEVVGDPLRVQQVLLNLVGNAIKFTPAGEVGVTLDVSARTTTEVVLHGVVRDTGIGIPGDKQQEIFEAFCQVDTSRARKYGGTGLGLTITAKLVALMGGRIWVESDAGKGSAFHFTVCLGLPGAEAVEGPTGKRVLVAEDNPVNRVLLDLILQKRQHHVTFVETPSEAKAAWDRAPFDLVLNGIPADIDGVGPVVRLAKPVQPAELLAAIDAALRDV